MNLKPLLKCIIIQMSYYIYKINGNGMNYYGSSHQPLYERKSSHLTQFRYWKKMEGKSNCCISRKILETTDEWTIEKIEENISTEQEALEREDWYINNYDCVNINNALSLTGDDMREYKAKWARHRRLKSGETPLIPIPLMTEQEKQETQTAYNISRRVENLTAERIEIIRLQNKKSRETHIQTDDEKAKANARAKAQREKIKADPEKLAEQKEYKKLKAREYRLKAKNAV